MADVPREGDERRRELDLDDRARLLPRRRVPRRRGGRGRGRVVRQRVLVELGPFDAPVVVEIDAAELQPAD